MSEPSEERGVVELSKTEAQDALLKTGLAIQCAGVEGGFFGAHSDSESFLAFKLCEGDITVWRLTGGSKAERKQHAKRVRESLIEQQPQAFKMIPRG